MQKLGGRGEGGPRHRQQRGSGREGQRSLSREREGQLECGMCPVRVVGVLFPSELCHELIHFQICMIIKFRLLKIDQEQGSLLFQSGRTKIRVN